MKAYVTSSRAGIQGIRMPTGKGIAMTVSVGEVDQGANDQIFQGGEPALSSQGDVVSAAAAPEVPAAPAGRVVRHRGRPRMNGLTGRILQEVYEAVGREGYAAFSLETVVKRSNTTRTTVYRRWRSKADLVSHALVARGFSEVPEDDAALNSLGAVWRRLQSDGLEHATALNIVSALVDPDIRRHMHDYEMSGDGSGMLGEPMATAARHSDEA